MALKDVSDARGTNLAASGIQDLKKIQSIKISLHKASQILGPHPTGESIDRLMREHFSGFTLAPEYREAILHRRPVSRTIYLDPTANALGMMIANNTQIYWLTTSHTNQPVLVAAIGAGAARFAGYYDNAELGRRLKQLLDRGMP
jgi:alkaline phosphatase